MVWHGCRAHKTVKRCFFQTIHEAHDIQTNGYLVTLLGDPETVLTRCSTALLNGQASIKLDIGDVAEELSLTDVVLSP